ncbi:hypothetical protein TrVGV298_000135 [Trichoderma virens]|nr:hypothetical protein TrVGV298_000135 [Trichoderma virens]
MVWPQNQIPMNEANVTSHSSLSLSSSSSSSSFSSLLELHPRLSIDRLHRIASPPPLRSSSSSPASQQDWQHQRQQQLSLDLVPYDPLTQHVSGASQSVSSLPSTALPSDFTTMPGSYWFDPDSRPNSPSSEDEGMFRLAHDTPSSWQSTNPHSFHPSLPSSQDVPPDVFPFQLIPSAQPRSSYPSSSASPPPFTNMTYSTQAASFLPSPPSSQRKRPTSPLSVTDSQPTLRQGDSRQLSSPPMSPIQRPQVRGRGGFARDLEETDAQALNAVVDGIGRMQVSMSLDQAGRWRIARRNDSPW